MNSLYNEKIRVLRRLAKKSDVLIPLCEKATRNEMMHSNDWYYVKTEYKLSKDSEKKCSFITYRAFKTLTKENIGDIEIEVDGETFMVSSDLLKVSLIGNENLIEYES